MSSTDKPQDNIVLREELAELERRINQRIDDKAASHEKTTQAHVDGLNARMDALIDTMNTKFDSVQKQFDSVQRQFDSVQKQFDSVQKQFDGVQKQFEGMQKQIEGVQRSLENFESKMTATLTNIENRQRNNIALLGILMAIVVSLAVAIGGWFIASSLPT